MKKNNFTYSNTLCGSLGDKSLISLTISSDFDYCRSLKFIKFCEKSMNNLLDKLHSCLIEEFEKDEEFLNDN